MCCDCHGWIHVRRLSGLRYEPSEGHMPVNIHEMIPNNREIVLFNRTDVTVRAVNRSRTQAL